MLEVRIPIRWSDIDAYGHVNNAVYLHYLEEARDAWVLHVLGAESDTWDFVLARVAIDFRSQLVQDDREVLVRCRLRSIGHASLRTREEVVKVDGTTSAEAESVVVPVAGRSGRSRPLTKRERVALQAELNR